MNFCKFTVKVRIFHKKKLSKTDLKTDNFYDIKKTVRNLLNILKTKKCAKFQVDWMKIIRFMLSADLTITVLRKTRHSRDFEKKLPQFVLCIKRRLQFSGLKNAWNLKKI